MSMYNSNSRCYLWKPRLLDTWFCCWRLNWPHAKLQDVNRRFLYIYPKSKTTDIYIEETLRSMKFCCAWWTGTRTSYRWCNIQWALVVRNKTGMPCTINEKQLFLFLFQMLEECSFPLVSLKPSTSETTLTMYWIEWANWDENASLWGTQQRC